MTDAVKAYEEKPRDQWLFDYPAQVSLCGTQIWWTSEVKHFLHPFQTGGNIISFHNFQNITIMLCLDIPLGWNCFW